MNKKLLATSALVSTLAFSSVSLAQTTITGSLDLTYRSHSFTASNGAASETTMGRESQINLANKGKLNNGLDYAAGFSLEFDGGNNLNETASISNENFYLDLIAGSTTITVGIDHIQNSRQDLINSVGDIVDEVGLGVVQGVILRPAGDTSTFTNPKESIGVGATHNFGNGIVASYNYVPNIMNRGTDNNGSATTSTTGTNSAYEVGIRGTNVANSGVSVDLWRNEVKKTLPSDTRDQQGTGLGLNYNKGPFGVGAARLKTERASASTELKHDLYTASYSFDKNLTASLVYVKTDDTVSSSTADEKIKSLMVGYNFGPVGLLVTASQVENIGALSTGGDADVLGISLNTRF